MRRSTFINNVNINEYTADYAVLTVGTRPTGECLRIRVGKTTLRKLVDTIRINLNDEKIIVGVAEFRWHRQERPGLYANYHGKARIEVCVGGDSTIVKIVIPTMHDPNGRAIPNAVAGSIVLDYEGTESARAALCKLIDKMDMMF